MRVLERLHILRLHFVSQLVLTLRASRTLKRLTRFSPKRLELISPEPRPATPWELGHLKQSLALLRATLPCLNSSRAL